MAKVVMRVGVTGSRDGVDWPPIGGELTCSEAEARDLIASGYAVSAVKPVEERAVAPKPEIRKGNSKGN